MIYALYTYIRAIKFFHLKYIYFDSIDFSHR